ncbi:uncharacterized protein LOC128437110 [Pleuronectes platessa]|uniref:uncharacterized protein LOC128437110 n=1 Tax=Pleuronectes platessa TaxID=8262 RepID=UPI00232A11D9|nr:uncharacterized protein LOC128437110 [Pleuronectes platessa]
MFSRPPLKTCGSSTSLPPRKPHSQNTCPYQDIKVCPALATPDYTKLIHLDVAEMGGVVNAVLFQRRSTDRCVLIYHSSKLDTVETGQSSCARYVAAVAKAIDKTSHVVMGHPTQIHTQHGVAAFLQSKEFNFSAARKTKLQVQCTQSHITFVPSINNMATNITSGTPHVCGELAIKENKLRPELSADPILNADAWLYTDGCCYKGEDGNVAAYAVVQQHTDGSHTTLEAGIIPQPASAQLAEVTALTRALELGQGQIVNVYTDSAYAHGAVQLDGPSWMRRGFLTTGDQPIRHQVPMRRLLSAVLLPRCLAVMKCKGHDTNQTRISAGNKAADQAAKEAGGYTPPQMVMASPSPAQFPELTEDTLIQIQEKAGPYEWSTWRQKGALKSKEGLWRSHDGRIVASAELCAMLLKEAHGLTHEGKLRTFQRISALWWHPHLESISNLFCDECSISGNPNPRRPFQRP